MSELDNVLHIANVAKLRNAIEKKAGFWRNFTKSISTGNVGKQVGEALVGAGAAAAVTGIGVGVGAGVKALREKIEKPRAFKGMMGAMPGLKKEDPKAVQMTFNTLYGMNRKMARDPLVAGSFVSRHVNRAEVGGEGGAYVDPQTSKTLMDAGRKPPGGISGAWEQGSQRADLYKTMGSRTKRASADPDKVEKFRAQLRKIRGK